MTESPRSPEAGHPRSPTRAHGEKERKEKIQKQLDEALADSFPASDPVSIVTSNEEEDWGESESER